MHTGAVTVIALFSAAAVLTVAAAAEPRWRRRLPKVIGLAAGGVLAAFLVGRGRRILHRPLRRPGQLP
jgi:hypothetical protein